MKNPKRKPDFIYYNDDNNICDKIWFDIMVGTQKNKTDKQGIWFELKYMNNQFYYKLNRKNAEWRFDFSTSKLIEAYNNWMNKKILGE